MPATLTPPAPRQDKPQSAVAPQPKRAAGRLSGRTWLNFWLDSALLAGLMALIWASVVVHFVFPPGPNAAGWKLWGWSYSQWSQFEFGLLGFFTLGIVVHLMLHWSWVCGVVAGQLSRWQGRPKVQWDDGTRTLIGVGVLIVALHLIGVGVAAAWLSILPPPG